MRLILLTGIAALAIACGPGAQASHNSSQADASARAGAADAGNQPTVTLVGCLQGVDQPDEPVGTIGTRKGGSPGERFTLINAKRESADSDPPAASYVLDGNIEDLRALTNQHVRIQGVLDAAAANSAEPQRVRVSTVEGIGGKCRS